MCIIGYRRQLAQRLVYHLVSGRKNINLRRLSSDSLAHSPSGGEGVLQISTGERITREMRFYTKHHQIIV